MPSFLNQGQHPVGQQRPYQPLRLRQRWLRPLQTALAPVWMCAHARSRLRQARLGHNPDSALLKQIGLLPSQNRTMTTRPASLAVRTFSLDILSREAATPGSSKYGTL